MHLLYVDESGDDGFPINESLNADTPTRVFVRAGLVVHDRKWRKVNNTIKNYRFKTKIPENIELHATEIRRGQQKIYIRRDGKKQERKDVPNWFGKNYPEYSDRIRILEDCCRLINEMEDITLICIVINKKQIDTNNPSYKEIPKNKSWEFLIERYNLFLDNAKDKIGIIISDAIQDKIERTHRDFAKAIYSQSGHVKEYHFVESIMFEPSDSSNLLQLVDIASYAFFRYFNYQDESLYNLIKDKLLCGSTGCVNGAGLKIWPE